jgi:hypothetical protein
VPLISVVLRGMFVVVVGAVRLGAHVIGGAIATTRRLYVKSLTMPRPRSYFWIRFGPIAGVCVLVLVLPLAFTSSPRATPVAANASGAAGGGDGVTPAASVPDASAATVVATAAAAPTAPAAPVQPPVADAPTSPPAAGRITAPAGVVLPNRARTPGAVNPDVNQGDLSRTICLSGWTATVRPPSSVTTALKVRQLATGYSYNGDTSTSHYEEDHLISLELGGAPSAEANLWPEPYSVAEGARVKDRVENRLHALVCAGSISLAAAQAAIAVNWWSAYERYVTGSAVRAPGP